MEPEGQPHYSIRTVSNRTGLSPDVLRAWERRYGAVAPARDARGVRLYTGADVARLRLLRRLTAEGHPIGRIAALPAAELRALGGPEGAGAAEGARPATSWTRAGAHAEATLDAMVWLDAPRVRTELMRAVVALPAREFTGGVVLPLLGAVGDLWRRGRILPAHEHLLSAQLVAVLVWLLDAIPAPAGAPEAIAVAPAGQRHELGALLASIAAAEEGWRVTYLGADLPAEDIAAAARMRGARAVLLSVLAAAEGPALLAAVRLLGAAPGAPRVFVGGAGARPLAGALEEAGATWLAGLDELREALGEFHGEGTER
jgi:MerR family transcriptional regulator, light-induced transcriptional regulator